MKSIILCMSLHVGLYTPSLYAQSCCTGSAGSNITIGLNSESMVLPKNVFGLELSNMTWGFNPSNQVKLRDNYFTDLKYVNTTLVALNFGMSDNLTLSVNIPLVNIMSDIYESSDGKMKKYEELNTNFGDMSLLLTYQLKLRINEKLKVIIISGIETPTGYTLIIIQK